MLQGLVAIMPRGTLPDEADLTLNLPILFFTLAATTLAGLLFGSAPAWYASRVDPGEALKEGNRTGVGAGRHRRRQTCHRRHRPRPGAAGRRRPRHSQLPPPPPRRSRTPHRPPPHLLPSR